MIQKHEKLYDNWMAIWNGDFRKIPDMIHKDFVGHWPDHDVEGIFGLEEAVKMGRAYFYDIRFEPVIPPICDGNRLSGYWKMTAHYLGNMEDAKADKGTPVIFKGMDILVFEDGKCMEYYVISDTMSLMKQLQIG
ncbi:ester cyclase [Virgibacillus ihumii]|uniref:ester cyclase n=1 Tax=Virgibacillus ihumii TaxID=2686091 RepID=UPI00157DBDF8|nr:ester cyclase [Virgibacillus ihumii]